MGGSAVYRCNWLWLGLFSAGVISCGGICYVQVLPAVGDVLSTGVTGVICCG